LTFWYVVWSFHSAVLVPTWALVDLGWGHDIELGHLVGDLLPDPNLVAVAVHRNGK
jgi:hypothetical protein